MPLVVENRRTQRKTLERRYADPVVLDVTSQGPEPCYTGKSMSESHIHLDITGQEWQAFLDDFRQTLDQFNVPEAERAELFAIVESTKNDIVVPKDLGGA